MAEEEWDLLELEFVEVELGSVEGQRVLNLVERERKLDQVWGEME